MIRSRIKLVQVAAVLAYLVVIPLDAQANILNNILGNLTGKNADATHPSSPPTRHQAFTQALNQAVKQVGYIPSAGDNVTLIVGEPGNVNVGLLDGSVIPVSKKLGSRVLQLDNRAFQNVEYSRNGSLYKLSLSNFIAPCNSNLSLCHFWSNFFPALQPNPFSIGSYVGRNIAWNSQLNVQKVLTGLSYIHQPGLNGKNKIYIFFDPDCSWCWHDFHVINDNISMLKKDYPNVSVEWVPTDIFRANKSAGRAEQALEGGFPALAVDFDHFDMRTETGGLSGVQIQSYQNSIAYNVATVFYLVLKYGIHGGEKVTRENIPLGTPMVVVLNNGIPTVYSGMPNLIKLFSTVNSY